MKIDTSFLQNLTCFHGTAAKATYASAKDTALEPQRSGFSEFDYRDGDWYYRDSFSGFLRSWGQEVVYFRDKPVWTCLYGGGMEPERMDQAFAADTFAFLKKALASGPKAESFQPRGPAEFREGSWRYHAALQGVPGHFEGHEAILHLDKIVFTHHFHGGLIVGKK